MNPETVRLVNYSSRNVITPYYYFVPWSLVELKLYWTYFPFRLSSESLPKKNSFSCDISYKEICICALWVSFWCVYLRRFNWIPGQKGFFFPGCFSSVQFSSVSQSCPTLCKPMDCSTLAFPVLHYLPVFARFSGNKLHCFHSVPNVWPGDNQRHSRFGNWQAHWRFLKVCSRNTVSWMLMC